MRTLTPSLAIGWQVWLRHRRGAAAATATLAVLIAAGPFVLARVRPEYALLGTVVTVYGLFGFLMNAALFVDAPGNMASGYPRRMYALPVSAPTLVLWPLLYGAVLVALLWVVASRVILVLSGFRTPVLLPALGLAVLMSWLHVLSWAPLRPAWLRLTAVLLFVLVGGGAVWALVVTRTVGDPWVVAFLVVLLVTAYPAALVAVASDRRGEAWRLWPEGLRLSFRKVRAPRRPFRSPAQAQLWYEWRCHGLVFPVTVALVSLLVLGFGTLRHAPAVHSMLLAALFVMPILLATSVGPATARFTPSWIKHPGAIGFLGTRPMTTGRIVSAKFRMAALSILLSWGVVLVEGTVVLTLEGQSGGAAELWKATHARFPGWHAPAVLALGFVMAPVLAFRQTTDYYTLALGGRSWIENLFALVVTSTFVGFLAVGSWLVLHPEQWPRFFAALPWLAGIVLALKAVVAAGAHGAALRFGLLGPRDVLRYAAAWLVLAAIATTLCALTLPANLQPATRTAALLGVVAFVPISRFALAPLALDWNRHR